jgi:hypothetical protein
MNEDQTKMNNNTDDVLRLVMRKFVLSLAILWMIPWWLLAQALRALLCLTVGIQNLGRNPICEAKESWDANA